MTTSSYLSISNPIYFFFWLLSLLLPFINVETSSATETKQQKEKKITMRVASIEKEANKYIDNFQYHYLAAEKETYESEMNQQAEYYNKIVQLLKVSLTDQSEEIQQKIMKKLHEAWQIKKKEAMSTQSDWEQFDTLAQLCDLLRAYYYTFLEVWKGKAAILDSDWLIKPTIFWKEVMLPLVKQQMKDMQGYLKNDSQLKNWIATNPSKIKKDQLFLQTAMQIAIGLNQNVKDMHELSKKFADHIAVLTDQQTPKKAITLFTEKLKKEIFLFLKADFSCINDSDVDVTEENIYSVVIEPNNQERNRLLKNIYQKGHQLYSLIVTMKSEEVKKVIEDLLEYLEEQVMKNQEANNSCYFDKIKEIGEKLAAVAINDNRETSNLWRKNFANLATIYADKSKAAIESLIAPLDKDHPLRIVAKSISPPLVMPKMQYYSPEMFPDIDISILNPYQLNSSSNTTTNQFKTGNISQNNTTKQIGQSMPSKQNTPTITPKTKNNIDNSYNQDTPVTQKSVHDSNNSKKITLPWSIQKENNNIIWYFCGFIVVLIGSSYVIYYIKSEKN